MNRKHFIFSFYSIIFIFLLFVLAFIFFGLKNENKNKIYKFDSNNELQTFETTEKMIPVVPLSQYPKLPTGCESTAAAMLLNYYKYRITPESFAENILIKEDFYYENGNLCGPHPDNAFIGDPFSENGYGCYADAIVSSINSNISEVTAVNISGKSLSEILSNYIDCGIPVMLWATMGMNEAKEGTVWQTDNGEAFTWISGEHCLVLIGYNDRFCFLNDPQLGYTVAYEKELVEKRFNDLNRQAVYIYKKS